MNSQKNSQGKNIDGVNKGTIPYSKILKHVMKGTVVKIVQY